MRDYPHVMDYFPAYKASYLPSRDYFWKIFGTVEFDATIDFIKRIREAKHKEKEKDSEKTIEISNDMLGELQNAQYF